MLSEAFTDVMRVMLAKNCSYKLTYKTRICRGCSDKSLPWSKKAASNDPLDTKYPYVVGHAYTYIHTHIHTHKHTKHTYGHTQAHAYTHMHARTRATSCIRPFVSCIMA